VHRKYILFFIIYDAKEKLFAIGPDEARIKKYGKQFSFFPSSDVLLLKCDIHACRQHTKIAFNKLFAAACLLYRRLSRPKELIVYMLHDCSGLANINLFAEELMHYIRDNQCRRERER
jgi:hypothetical protein